MCNTIDQRLKDFFVGLLSNNDNIKLVEIHENDDLPKILEYFDPSKLMEGGQIFESSIFKNLENPVFLVADNKDYNETYVIDQLIKVLDESEILDEIPVTIIYCDNVYMRMWLSGQAPEFIENLDLRETEMKYPPLIIGINPNKGEDIYGIVTEDFFSTITINKIRELFEYLNICEFDDNE